MPSEVVDRKLDEAAESLVKGVPEELKEEKKKHVKAQMSAKPYSVVAESWPGRELFLVEHLGSGLLTCSNALDARVQLHDVVSVANQKPPQSE